MYNSGGVWQPTPPGVINRCARFVSHDVNYSAGSWQLWRGVYRSVLSGVYEVRNVVKQGVPLEVRHEKAKHNSPDFAANTLPEVLATNVL